MSISGEEKKLFDEWKKSHEGAFVCDGVVSEEGYLKSKPKIVFILKEVKAGGTNDWALRECLKPDNIRGMWGNIARWVDGIKKINAIPDWKDFEEIKPESIKSIGVLNLKKSPGGARQISRS